MTAPQPKGLCPVCRTELIATDRQGVEIDYCPLCRGVWLDRGELDKIIERTVIEDPTLLNLSQGGFKGRRSHDADDTRRTRTASWLGDLFHLD
jgi:Zn-finger nucleic acid-binding protein